MKQPWGRGKEPQLCNNTFAVNKGWMRDYVCPVLCSCTCVHVCLCSFVLLYRFVSIRMYLRVHVCMSVFMTHAEVIYKITKQRSKGHQKGL